MRGTASSPARTAEAPVRRCGAARRAVFTSASPCPGAARARADAHRLAVLMLRGRGAKFRSGPAIQRGGGLSELAERALGRAVVLLDRPRGARAGARSTAS